jgi:alkanesulfonate monooxygenase SsuD/methylene tetrahydromethanopterin reductase-like flavin-dependent oxidoreductase (luciferase family)
VTGNVVTNGARYSAPRHGLGNAERHMVDLSVQIEIAGGLTWDRWKRIVPAVDRMGYRGLYVCDHFLAGSRSGAAPGGFVDSVEIMLAFTYLAAHSARLEFGSLVSPVSFRHPVWLARQAMALDDLSGGRMVLGVGAGWMEREHAAFGFELGDVKTRMRRFAEALQVIDLLVRRDEPVSFSGRFYTLQDARLLPRSPRPGGVRLLVGGAGPTRTLPLTARYANAWNSGPRSPEGYREVSTLLDELVAKAGRQPRDVRRTLMQQVICYRHESELDARLRHVAPNNPGLSGKALLEAMLARTPNVIAGSPAQVIDRMHDYAAAGVEEIMVQRLDLDDDEGLAIIAQDVLPHV